MSCYAASCTAEVLDVLKGKIVVAWILKEEDIRLNELGFRSKRPDPEGAYRAAGIKLL